MKFSKRTNILLLIFLIAFSIVMRIPPEPHEIGSDSFANHLLADSISRDGYAKWIVHPLSFFGLYPLSYPSGGIFFLSAMSQSMNINMEYTILLSSLLIGIMGALFVYILAKDIKNDTFFAFSVAMLFSASRIFLGWTTWTFTTRGMFIAIFPLILWSLIKMYNTNHKHKYIFLLLLFSAILGTVHRMIFFIIAIIFTSWFISIFLYKLLQCYSISKKAISFYSLLFMIFLISPLVYPIYAPDFEYLSKAGYFFQGTGFYIVFLNLGAWYAMGNGILLILVPLGVLSQLYLLYKEKAEFPNVFFLITLLLCLPFLMDLKYMRTFMILIISIFIGFGFVELIGMFDRIKLKRKTTVVILVVILLGSLMIPMVITVHKTAPSLTCPSYMHEQTYNTGLFMGKYCNGSFTSDNVIGRMAGAISGTLIPPLLNTDFFNFSTNMRQTSIESFIRYRGNMFTLDDPIIGGKYYLGRYEYYIYQRPFDDPLGQRLWRAQQIRYVLVNIHDTTEKPFLKSIHENINRVYDDGFEYIYGVLI